MIFIFFLTKKGGLFRIMQMQKGIFRKVALAKKVSLFSTSIALDANTSGKTIIHCALLRFISKNWQLMRINTAIR